MILSWSIIKFTTALSGGDVEFMVWSDSEERFKLLASRLREQLRPNRWRCLEMPVVLAEFFWKGEHRHSSSAKIYCIFLGKELQQHFFLQLRIVCADRECALFAVFPCFPYCSLGYARPQLWAPVGYTQFCPFIPNYSIPRFSGSYYVLATGNCIQTQDANYKKCRILNLEKKTL